MKCTHVCAAQTTYLFFDKLYMEPDFPILADEIAEARPDINIKVAAFTVSEKSSNTPLYASTGVPVHLISFLSVRSGTSKENS